MCGLRCWAMDGRDERRDGVCGGAESVAYTVADCIADCISDAGTNGCSYGITDGGMRSWRVFGGRLFGPAVV